MHILVSNDDGVNAPGIRVLAQAMASLAKVTVVAPDRDRSAASHSLTLENPLRMVPLDNGFLSINGTPTDCVHLALTGWLAELPEMVVSGINAGANLGDDVLYSGTVAAAIEGRFLGFPTLAVSLVGNHNKLENYATAGECARRIVEHLLVNPLAKETIFNVNVPDLPLSEVKGIQVTRLGARHRAEQMVRSHDPRGRPIYWLGPAGAGQDIGPGTDFYAVNHGYVSVTPLKTDLTDHHALDGMQHWFSQFRLVPV